MSEFFIDEDKLIAADITNISDDAALWGLEALAEQYVNYDEKGHPRLPVGQNKKWLQVLEYAITKIHQAAALKEENERLKKTTIGRWSRIDYDPREDRVFSMCDSCQLITWVSGRAPAQYCATCGAKMENGGEGKWKFGIN